MHAGLMADAGRYLTVKGVIGAIAEELLMHIGCLRRGHDPVRVDTQTRLCRRCYRPLR